MKKLRVLLMGAAFSADLHSDGYSQIKDKVQIVGICDRRVDRIYALAARYGFTGYTAYDDIDSAIAQCDGNLVDICMPNFLHHDVVIKAMNAGRDIICEKPLATTVEDAQDMVDTAARLGKHIYYAEDWLFAPAFRKALKIIDSGKVGKPLYIRARKSHCGSHSPFTQTIKFCGGESNMVHRKMEGEDWAGAFLRFADGTYATLEANYVPVGGMEDVLDIYCEQGCVHVDLSFSGPVKVFSIPGLDYTVEKAEITTGWSHPAVDEKYNLGYCGEINHFVDCALAGVDAQVGLRGRDGLETLKVINLIYRSAKEGVHIRNDALEG